MNVCEINTAHLEHLECRRDIVDAQQLCLWACVTTHLGAGNENLDKLNESRGQR